MARRTIRSRALIGTANRTITPASQREASPMHTHSEDIIFMRSGRICRTVEDESPDAGPGDTIITPRGIDYMFEVLGGEPAQVVCVYCPPAVKRT